MWRSRGIEPLASAWKAEVLPLYELRFYLNVAYLNLFIKSINLREKFNFSRRLIDFD